MQLPLDRNSPVPLYHQLTEALRWQISTGRLSAGDRLPALRDAARELGVNMHTVRRAYAALADDGLVESNGSRGTWVLGRRAVDRDGDGPPVGSSDELQRFLAATAERARQRFALAPAELGRLLVSLPQAATPGEPGGVDPAEVAAPVVHVLECSESQCRDHAEEITAAWAVDARPWSLERSGEPPDGPLVATYFHYAEILRRWPHRRCDLHFLPIHVDPGLPHRLASAERLLACELNEDKARNLQADLEALFPPGAVRVVARVVADPAAALETAAGHDLLCFAPRAWARLSTDQRHDPRVRKVRYVIETGVLDDLGQRLGWPRAATGSRSPA